MFEPRFATEPITYSTQSVAQKKQNHVKSLVYIMDVNQHGKPRKI